MTENRDWLSGEKLVAWLEEMVPETVARARAYSKHTGDYDQELGGLQAALLRWSKPDSKTSVFTVDRFLTQIGLHISLVPSSVFTSARPRHAASKTTYPADLRAAVRATDDPAKDVAKRFGISPNTVNRWRREERQAA